MTKLSPLEEVLFRTWARANGVDNHDDPNNYFDHRGLWKQSNGAMQPIGVINSMAQAHNQGIEAQQNQGDSGDITFPDPYMAQAEMHKATLDHDSKNAANQQKMEIEKMKMAHTSQEKEKDRAHKLQLEQMKQQQRAQEQEAQRQARAQEAEANRAARAQEAEAMRQHGMQQSVMQEQFERSRPQPAPSMPGVPGAEQQMGDPSGTQGSAPQGGLESQIQQRMGGGY